MEKQNIESIKEEMLNRLRRVGFPAQYHESYLTFTGQLPETSHITFVIRVLVSYDFSLDHDGFFNVVVAPNSLLVNDHFEDILPHPREIAEAWDEAIKENFKLLSLKVETNE